TIRWCLEVEAGRANRGRRSVPELPGTLAWRHQVVTPESGRLRFAYDGRFEWRYPNVLPVVDIIINENLRGAAHCVVRDAAGRATLGWDAPNLIDALYIMAAEAITQQAVALCDAEHCRKPFRRTHPLQRYCPPASDGAAADKERSACSNQQRQRDFVKRHRKR